MADLPSLDLGVASGGARQYDPAVAANPDANASLDGLYRFGATADEALASGPVANLALLGLGLGGSNTLSGDEATAKYGVQGPTKDTSLSWEPWQAVTENQAQLAQAMTQNRIKDEYISSLRPSTWAGWAPNAAGDFMGSAMDPLNTAASFIPVGWLGRGAEVAFNAAKLTDAAASASTLTRGIESSLAGRIGAAGLQNAAAVALTQPIIMAGAQADHTDYTFTDAALNTLFGGLLGAGLHGLGEGVGAGFRRFTQEPDSLATPEAGASTGSQSLSASPEAQAAGLPLDLPRSTDQNQLLADQMAQRLGNQDLTSITAALNPRAMEGAWNSASEVARDIGADENLTVTQKQEGIGAINRFIGEMNDHAGSLQYTPVDPEKIISGGGSGGNLDDFYAQLHPSVDSISDALEAYRNLQDLKTSRVSPSGTVPAILGSGEPIDWQSLADGSIARGMVRAGIASMDSTHGLSPLAAEDMLAASRPRVISDLTQQLNRPPKEDEIGTMIEQRSQAFMDNKATGKYDPAIQPLDPLDTAHATPDAIQQAVDTGDYETAAKLAEQHVKSLEQDPAFRLSDEDKADVNKPVEELSTIQNLMQDFTDCVAQEAA